MTSNDLKQIDELLQMRLEGFATKEDLKQLATKQDVEGFATKEDLKQLATKQDVEGFATKEDLKQFAMKQDVEEIVQAYANELKNFIGESAVPKSEFIKLEHRVTKLEEN
jgi:hypothetical protein